MTTDFSPKFELPRFNGHRFLSLIALIIGVLTPINTQGDQPSVAVPLERMSRSISLVRPEPDQGNSRRTRGLAWRLDYHLRLGGEMPIDIVEEAISVTVDGFASNSRAEGHHQPHQCDHHLSSETDFVSQKELISARRLADSCHEQATLRIHAELAELDSHCDSTVPKDREHCVAVGHLKPGSIVHVIIFLEHLHELYGPVEPLFGPRTITVQLGPAAFRDDVMLDPSVAQPPMLDQLASVPNSRRDRRVAYSPPDSLYLDTDLEGQRSYTFPDLNIPRDTPLVFRFRYLRSQGACGSARAELKQYHDVSGSFRSLPKSRIVESLERDGEWVLVEHVIRTELDATTARLRFSINDADGPAALWIDDITLEPLGSRSASNP